MSFKSFEGATGRKWVTQQSHRQWLLRQADALIEFYKPHCRDRRGGFYDLDDFGKPLPTGWPPSPTPSRTLFATVRMVHCFSLAHLMGRPGSDDIVDHGMRFLWHGHRDVKHGGYHWRTGYNGPTDSSKQAYGHAFVLLAASSAKVVGHPDADRILDDATNVLMEKFWEAEHGAVAEEFNEDWSAIGHYRGQNSNMHLTEACMAAFEATGQQHFLSMALSIADLIINRITARNDWRLPEHFDQNWNLDPQYDRDVFRPFGTTVGHWLEWSRLLLQLWEAGGRTVEWLPEAARTLFRKATSEGWDPHTGGFYFTLDWQGRPRIRDRYWWPCAEGIGAAAFLNAIDGDPFYEEWYRRIWSWTDTHLIDHENGGWRHQLNDELLPVTDPWYGKPDMYHAFQACLIPLLPTSGSVSRGLLQTGV
ncbi:AGE family epimerase/isomerase [Burkholderia cepacia]|uniref:AGE family epimerase/isomerase n=1 Tax=Burkholderia cepacia TaxID=292 RepID=UPI00075AF66D|nr:AGE family epimerase/isomerase [Burkholderia cepacia]KVS70066.1 mannose-6-phosphate isomerase [Burkholderia cepacia]